MRVDSRRPLWVDFDADAWREIARRVTRQYPPDLRLRAGQPATPLATFDLACALGLPRTARHYLAHEMRLRWNLAFGEKVADLLVAQQSDLRRRVESVEAQPGYWAVPHVQHAG